MAALDLKTRQMFKASGSRPLGLRSLLPPQRTVEGEQQEDAKSSSARLSSHFTRKRQSPEPVDAHSEIMSALVLLTKLIAVSKVLTSPASVDTAPKTPTPSQTKPKRKRIRAKTERRRLQCRMNQARYRNRQRGFVRELEDSVNELQEEIQELTVDRHTLCYGVQTKNNVWNVVVEYFRLLRYGFLVPLRGLEATSKTELRDQDFFLRATMDENVAVGELFGVDALIEQWQRYSFYFGNLSFKLNKMEQQPFGAIAASATLSITITEATLRYVFPHLVASNTDEGQAAGSPLGNRLLGRRLDCQCSVRFTWDKSTGRVTRLDAAMDMLTPLLRVLGKIEDVSHVLQEALITPAYLIGEVEELAS